MKGKDEILISFDIETDGPCPGLNSMLSLGAVAVDVFAEEPTILSEWSGNFLPLPGANQDPHTMDNFWAGEPDAWDACQKDQQDPLKLMTSLAAWSRNLWVQNGKRKTFAAAYPAGFDWPFIYYYGHRFLGRAPWSFACFDAKTYAMALMHSPSFRGTAKKKMPKRWFRDSADDAHTHVAVEDAREQGLMMARMIRENQGIETHD